MIYCNRCTYPIVAVNLAMGDEQVCSGCIVSDEKYNCEVFNSHDEYFVAMEELIVRLEKLIEVRQSENQI